MSPADDVLLVDASIYIFRAYFSMPDHWQSDEGFGTGAVYGYGQFLLNLIEQTGASHLACCYDESLTHCFRNQLYPAYKANRELPDEALAFQLRACRELSQLLGIPSHASPVYEADDLIGALMQRAHCELAEQRVAVVTRDKDLGQLLAREQDYLWNFADQEQLFAEQIVSKFGVRPEQLVDYLALVGDKIDNIPGVPGVGAKTAAVMLQHYASIEALFANLPALVNLPVRGAKSLATKLEQHLEQIALAKMLATIVTDIPFDEGVDPLQRQSADLPELRKFCEAMGFPRLMTRLERLLG
ncbi:5'-3' exonuclease H3TH domain-containing protein [Halioxenophilus sp. WMMB6]|uniref:5'-3' exonuclease n=1 Tax=Halioxenophilus sp. WMMB6 TaxID=3073815 RepID=UPI00295ECFB7|nr:5'-3' exonuclease H3TH domain-containing protein [Halioxenophilus sp. WMMB6]